MGMSYCENTQQVEDWTCQPCKDSNTSMVPGQVKVLDVGIRNKTRIVVGKLQDQDGCILAFRGSSNARNWISDFAFLKEPARSTFPSHGVRSA